MSTKFEDVTEVFEYDEANCVEFVHPSEFYIINALGQYVYIKHRSRAKCQRVVDNEYGVGKYKVNSSKYF